MEQNIDKTAQSEHLQPLSKPVKSAPRAMILLCHGSADPEWTRPFVALQELIAAKSPQTPVAIAYLDPAKPNFADVTAQLAATGVQEIIVAPIFLARGGHIKKDLPELVEAARTLHGLAFQVLPTLGEIDTLLEAIAGWVIHAAEVDQC